MSDVVEFLCVKVQADLDDYGKTGIIPDQLEQGFYTLDDVHQCLTQLPEKYQRIGNSLARTYTRKLQKNIRGLKEDLRIDYYQTLENLETTSYDLIFPSVLNRYRPDINPVSALYYDTREMVRHFNPEDDRHIWLHSIIVDSKLNNKILDALSKDIKQLEKIVKKYYWPLTQLDDRIPLELFHARQMIKDFSQFYVFFAGILDYDPDNHH